MELNILTQTMNFQFENKENLKQAAKNILTAKNTSEKTIDKIINQTVFSQTNALVSPQADNFNIAAQISMNNSLKETLKYLKSKSTKKNTKKAILGELWDSLSKEDDEDFTKNALYDFEIEESAKNIFIAA